MTDDPTPDPKDTPPVDPPDDDPPNPPDTIPDPPSPIPDTDDMPGWAKTLRTDVDTLIHSLTKPDPPTDPPTPTPSDDGDPTMPKDGKEIEDQSAVKKPWHKRGIGGGKYGGKAE